MRMNKLILGTFAVALSFLTTDIQAEVTTIAVLDRGEPHDALAFVGGALWVGTSRKQFTPYFKVDAFDQNNQLIGSVELPHSASQISPYDDNSVIVNGTSTSPNLTMFTILKLNSNRTISKSTTTVPVDAWATKWLGTINGRQYFTDPGGNNNDSEGTNNPNLAAQTLFSISHADPKYLATRMRMPVAGQVWNNQLLVIQKPSMNRPESNAAVIDYRTGTAKYLFEGDRNDLSNIAILPQTNSAVFSERGASQIVIYDLISKSTIGTAATSEGPRSLNVIGHCTIVAGFEGRTVDVIDLRDTENPKTVLKLDINLSTREFARLSHIATDVQTGRVYARSNLACNPFIGPCNDDSNRVVAFDNDVSQTILKNCH